MTHATRWARLVRHRRLRLDRSGRGAGVRAARGEGDEGVLPLRAIGAVVAARDFDGGDDVLDGHAEPGHRHGTDGRGEPELAVLANSGGTKIVCQYEFIAHVMFSPRISAKF